MPVVLRFSWISSPIPEVGCSCDTGESLSLDHGTMYSVLGVGDKYI